MISYLEAADAVPGLSNSRTANCLSHVTGTGLLRSVRCGLVSASSARLGNLRRVARQRSQVVDEAIVASTLAVIADRGVEGFSVEEVASRASVGKATIYRRYSDRNALINAALETLNDDLPEIDEELCAEDVLVDMLEWVRTSTSSGSELLPRIFAQARSNPELFRLCHERVIAPRLQRMEEVLRRGVDRGELSDSVDFEVTASMLVAPVLMFGMLNGTGRGSGHRDFVARLVEQSLQGMRPANSEDEGVSRRVPRRASRRLRKALVKE